MWLLSILDSPLQTTTLAFVVFEAVFAVLPRHFFWLQQKWSSPEGAGAEGLAATLKGLIDSKAIPGSIDTRPQLACTVRIKPLHNANDGDVSKVRNKLWLALTAS